MHYLFILGVDFDEAFKNQNLNILEIPQNLEKRMIKMCLIESKNDLPRRGQMSQDDALTIPYRSLKCSLNPVFQF